MPRVQVIVSRNRRSLVAAWGVCVEKWVWASKRCFETFIKIKNAEIMQLAQ